MKKSIFIICALLLFNLSSFAQMTITPYTQADLTYRILSPESTLSVENIENVKEMYTPKLGYTFGANLQYDFNEKWALKTGVMFQDMGDKIVERDLIWSNPDHLLFDGYKLIHHYQFINIPIQAQYNFSSTSKFSPYIAFGGSVNWNVKNYYVSTLYQEEEVYSRSTDDFNNSYLYEKQTINFSVKTDVGFCYKLNEKFSLNTFLSGNILLLPTNQSNVYNPRHFNIGVGLGVGYAI